MAWSGPVARLCAAGSGLCENYLADECRAGDRPELAGYGGAYARAYSLAGSANVLVAHALAANVSSGSGGACGFDVINDSRYITLRDTSVRGVATVSEAALSLTHTKSA